VSAKLDRLAAFLRAISGKGRRPVIATVLSLGVIAGAFAAVRGNMELDSGAGAVPGRGAAEAWRGSYADQTMRAVLGAAPAGAGFQSPAAMTESAAPDLSAEQARLMNASIPVSTQPVIAARPLVFEGGGEDRARAVNCLASAIYYEAAYEPPAGQAAVAQVVLNRLRHPLFPKTVCGVVFQGSELSTGCQFTFTCDGALARRPEPVLWERARRVAERALNGDVARSVGLATHYHADYVVPYWAPYVTKIGQIGTHIFYRWSGGMGLPAAFNGRYAGGERVAFSTFGELLKAGVPMSDADEPRAPALALAETTQPTIAPVAEVALERVGGEPLAGGAPLLTAQSAPQLELAAPRGRAALASSF
jgi:spore germination cell wall hydrolase CwlJ-like protein